MCNYKTLNANKHGYIVQCNSCNHIQITFGSGILTLSVAQFYKLIDTVDALYIAHNLYPFPDQKAIKIPTDSKSVVMIFSVNELKELLYLLIGSRNSIQHLQLFVFNEN